jgi:flagellar biosynthesis/type III secretory pathway M-ring protein FliF/YscJ
MTDAQFKALLDALSPSYVEIFAYGATIIMALLAGYALLFARGQILASRSGTKATFLVELDRRWEGSEMKDDRAKWREMRDSVTARIQRSSPQASAKEKHEKRREYCSNILHNMLRKSPEEYTHIIRVWTHNLIQ